MAKSKKRIRRCDMDLTSVLLFFLVYCILALLFTYIKGTDVMFYGGFPVLISALYNVAGLFGVQEFVNEKTMQRLLGKKSGNVMTVLQSAMLVLLPVSILTLFVFYVLAGVIGTSFFGFRLIRPILRSFAPSLALCPLLGSMMGFLRGLGQKRFARIALWMHTALFLALGIALGFFYSYRGSKVGHLLQNEDMSAVYCAVGIGIALGISSALVFCYLSVLCFINAGRIREQKAGRNDLIKEERRGENIFELSGQFIQSIMPGAGICLIIFFGLFVGYRLWITGRTSSDAITASIWGGFMGVGLPMVVFFGILLAIGFTSQSTFLVRCNQKNKPKTMRRSLSIMLRLSSYVSIPTCAYLFGAAKEIVGVFPNLTFKAEESAILTLKAGSFSVFFLQTLVLVVGFFWSTGHQREVVISAAVGMFVEIVFLVTFNLLDGGITMLAWSMDLMLLVMTLTLYILGKQYLIRGMKSSWFVDDVLIAVCAAIAVLPIELLNDYLVLVMAPWLSVFLSLFGFGILYIILSLLLHAADLRNIHLLWGGGWILQLAMVLGVIGEEVEV